MNTTNSSTACYMNWQYFHEPGADLTVLQTAFVATVLLIVTSNGVLLRRLLSKKKKRRADRLFILLSLSDMGVGAFTVPLLSLQTFSLKQDVICFLHRAMIFFTYYPYSFSWFMVIIIAIDRCLIITKFNSDGKYVTNRVLYIFIGFFFVAIICGVIVVISGEDFSLYSRKISVIFIFQTVLELLFIFTTTALYAYLLYYVRGKVGKFSNSSRRHCQQSYSSQLTKSIFLIYLCLVLFTLPQVIGLLVRLCNPSAKPSHTTIRNKYSWLVLSLYSNSYANAVILLYMSRNK